MNRSRYKEDRSTSWLEAKQQVSAMKISLEGKVMYNLEMDLPLVEYMKSYAKENKIDLVVVGCEGYHSHVRAVLMGTAILHSAEKLRYYMMSKTRYYIMSKN